MASSLMYRLLSALMNLDHGLRGKLEHHGFGWLVGSVGGWVMRARYPHSTAP